MSASNHPIFAKPLQWLTAAHDGLVKHVGRHQSGMTWSVYMNGVHVGTLTDADRARIDVDVLHDPRTYAAQLNNLIAVVARLGCYLLLLAAGLSVALSVTQDMEMMSLQFRLSALFYLWPRMLLLSTVVVIGVTAFCGFGFSGFADRFQEERKRRIRVLCRVSALGDLQLIPPLAVYTSAVRSNTARAQ